MTGGKPLRVSHRFVTELLKLKVRLYEVLTIVIFFIIIYA